MHIQETEQFELGGIEARPTELDLNTKNLHLQYSRKNLDHDPNWFKRGVREAIHIRVHRQELQTWGGGGGGEHVEGVWEPAGILFFNS